MNLEGIAVRTRRVRGTTAAAWVATEIEHDLAATHDRRAPRALRIGAGF